MSVHTAASPCSIALLRWVCGVRRGRHTSQAISHISGQGETCVSKGMTSRFEGHHVPCNAGALAAARVEQGAIVGMCLGMSGVDREADANLWKASLEEWLSKEASSACLKP